MRLIQRGPTPNCLNNVNPRENWHNFTNSQCYDLLCAALFAEQQGICVYCEQKIHLDNKNCHIEHLQPRSRDQSRSFDYLNLALSCNHATHCGHYKDNQWHKNFFIPPYDPEINGLFRYNLDGKMISSGKDDEKANFMIECLGLNDEKLQKKRYKIIKVMLDYLKIKMDSEIIAFLQKNFIEPDNDNLLPNFPSLARSVLRSIQA
ncbi:MAG: TIGR02646 family protein [Candidatus Symbiobacter sp.]|nr:TIGR02646 family protein [Candidatus Symbiobacter sp.]